MEPPPGCNPALFDDYTRGEDRFCEEGEALLAVDERGQEADRLEREKALVPRPSRVVTHTRKRRAHHQFQPPPPLHERAGGQPFLQLSDNWPVYTDGVGPSLLWVYETLFEANRVRGHARLFWQGISDRITYKRGLIAVDLFPAFKEAKRLALEWSADTSRVSYLILWKAAVAAWESLCVALWQIALVTSVTKYRNFLSTTVIGHIQEDDTLLTPETNLAVLELEVQVIKNIQSESALGTRGLGDKAPASAIAREAVKVTHDRYIQLSETLHSYERRIDNLATGFSEFKDYAPFDSTPPPTGWSVEGCNEVLRWVASTEAPVANKKLAALETYRQKF